MEDDLKKLQEQYDQARRHAYRKLAEAAGCTLLCGLLMYVLPSDSTFANIIKAMLLVPIAFTVYIGLRAQSEAIEWRDKVLRRGE